jgi:hypothetical protein
MLDRGGRRARVFKTAWFSRAARKANLTDEELCASMRQVMLGQTIDLGGGVFKKRLDKNRSRSIIVAKSRRYWIYAYLFAKKDKANIGRDELMEFRDLADLYERKTDSDIAKEVQLNELVEICHEKEAQI